MLADELLKAAEDALPIVQAKQPHRGELVQLAHASSLGLGRRPRLSWTAAGALRRRAGGGWVRRDLGRPGNRGERAEGRGSWRFASGTQLVPETPEATARRSGR